MQQRPLQQLARRRTAAKGCAADLLMHLLTPPHHTCPWQVLGSMLFIVKYYYRRVTWRLKQRKGKKRIAEAARDALAIKKKNSDMYGEVYPTGVLRLQGRVRSGVGEACSGIYGKTHSRSAVECRGECRLGMGAA